MKQGLANIKRRRFNRERLYYNKKCRNALDTFAYIFSRKMITFTYIHNITDVKESVLN
jgi:hypothetical protein